MSEYKIAEYNQTAIALAELRTRYAKDYDVGTAPGMAEAKAARATVRGYRVALEKTRVEIKAPALERTRLIDAEAKRITAELLAIEEPIDVAIKAEEARKAEEKAAKERAEAERINVIKAKIDGIKEFVLEAANNKDSSYIESIIGLLERKELSLCDYGEMLKDAETAKAEAIKKAKAILEERIAYEAEQARIKEAQEARLNAEREELARLRAAENKRRAEEESRQAAERKRQDEEAARLNAEREAVERARAEIAERQRREAEEKHRKDALAAIRSITDVKSALSRKQISSDDAIDKAYLLGVKDGKEGMK